MTTEIEKQFFNTFGIEPKKQCYYWDCPYSTGNIVDDTPMNERDCNSCKNLDKEVYPEITDRILLELMELLMKQQATEFYYNDEYLFSSKLLGSNRPTCNKVKNLRELVLITANCLGGFAPLKDKMLNQVRTLFKEVKNDNRN